MVVTAPDPNELARAVDKATGAGFKLHGGVAMCMFPDPITKQLVTHYAQSLVSEFWVSDGDDHGT